MSGVICRGFKGALMEVARGGRLDARVRAELAGHLDTCRACRAVLDSQMRLSLVAGELASEAAQFTAPWRVEAALLAELDSRVGKTAAARGFGLRGLGYGVVGAAIAASLAVAWISYRPARMAAVTHRPASAQVLNAVSQPARPVMADSRLAVVKRHKRAVSPAVEPEQPFIAIPYTLPLEPYERADVVRMEIPVAALIAAGVPTNMMDPGALAQTDILVGQDGRPRAVRLISVSTSN